MKISFERIIIISLALVIVFLSSALGISISNHNKTTKEEIIEPKYQSENFNLKIERKFLVDASDIPSDFKRKSDIYDLEQAYINYIPELRVRRINGNWYYFTLKNSKGDTGLVREETELEISKETYQDLIKKKIGETIYKTRYQCYEDGTFISIDIYSGSLEGLIVAEVEFKSEEAANEYSPPKWFGKDVTNDIRYKNASLSKDGIPINKDQFTKE